MQTNIHGFEGEKDINPVLPKGRSRLAFAPGPDMSLWALIRLSQQACVVGMILRPFASEKSGVHREGAFLPRTRIATDKLCLACCPSKSQDGAGLAYVGRTG